MLQVSVRATMRSSSRLRAASLSCVIAPLRARLCDRVSSRGRGCWPVCREDEASPFHCCGGCVVPSGRGGGGILGAELQGLRSAVLWFGLRSLSMHLAVLRRGFPVLALAAGRSRGSIGCDVDLLRQDPAPTGRLQREASAWDGTPWLRLVFR